jgi:hypothetical protein
MAQKENATVRELKRLHVALAKRDGLEGHRAPEGFVSNVVCTSGSKVVTRLKGLCNLVEAGFQVSTLSFNLFEIQIDGIHVGSISELEKHAKHGAIVTRGPKALRTAGPFNADELTLSLNCETADELTDALNEL